MSFCDACKEKHSMKVLKLQVEHDMTIAELLLDSTRFFQSVQWMGDYLGVSFVTVYHWIEKYYGMTYQEFKRKYICKCDKCYLLDISSSPYSRNDYILNKIRNRHGCACFDSRYPNYIMTKMPLSQVMSLFKDAPNVKQVKEGVYSLIPKPVRFNRIVNPVRFGEFSIIPEDEYVEENVIDNLGRYDIFEVLTVSSN
jgi:hypothetical protein